jgi:2-haloacid dehalogenase
VDYELITFDAYAALVDYRSSLLPVVEAIPGIDRGRAADFLELWRARQLGAAAMSNALEKGRIPFRECTALALDYALNRHGLSMDGDAREELIQAWYPLTPWPEADRVLSALAAKGYGLAILSNGDQDMLEALAAGFETPFDHILSSEQCGMYKPHPRVYGLPARELGIERYLHVAGSPNDAIGASAAGVSCYWSNRQGDTVLLTEYPPAHQGPDLSGVLDLI